MKRLLCSALVAASMFAGFGVAAKSTTLKMLYWAEPKVEKAAWETVLTSFPA